MKRTGFWLAVIAALAGLTGCESTGPSEDEVGAITISAPQNQTRLDIGSSLQLTAAVLNTTGVAMSSVAVEWRSSQAAVAAVSPSGIVTALAAGATTITARSGGVSGSIDITVSPPMCTSSTTVGSVAAGQTRSGTLGLSDCMLPHEAPGEGWAFSTSVTTSVRVDLRSNDFDALIVITDMQFNPIAWADDTDEGTDAVLITSVPAGSYVVWATTFPGESGTYQLEVQEVETASCTEPTGSINAGQTIAGTLALTDCLMTSGAFADLWQFVTSTTVTLQIDLSSGAFDTYLYVSDNTGTFIASDDDSGGNLNSRLVLTLVPGTYAFWASSYSRSMVGSYQLTASPVSGGVAAGPLLPADPVGFSDLREKPGPDVTARSLNFAARPAKR